MVHFVETDGPDSHSGRMCGLIIAVGVLFNMLISW